MASDKKESIEYNPRWFGYLLIQLMSLVNFAAIADIGNGYQPKSVWAVAMSFGCVTFVLSLLIIIFDRTPRLQEKFDFKECLDGKLEGCVLLAMTFWWLAGVGLITRADGIAYHALNIYFTSWGSACACAYTLNEWGSAKDIISVHELTRLSATLPAWYVLFLSSLVLTGTAADVFEWMKQLSKVHNGLDEFVEWSVTCGAVSTFVSLCYILLHYRLVRCCEVGNLIEVVVALLLVLWWIISVAILTQSGGIGATITGKRCEESDDIPGSNLYMSSWICLFSSCAIAVQWKSAQALQFAQAQERSWQSTGKDGKISSDTEEDAI
uniref:MARVEL domain-containing protein n=1 Tax=Odontella aurita TaxID=265563 RepID=A0A7S4N783_9STRA|mmetsp:Transcript_50705/g.152715  ORF Transcript_50705/g.152715 Transcript_50705/m.152715 type:complete len:324 (+) Transcript_50705:146-1117(+)|eukprot:CAMPEP_0113558686 /NCGR_PEP_ID=MMETSP0015_2-20120614/18486_1 /TAXON_ID=2838 /ORGANISM="Odontella" /LENGTH=323 /DNA_ID=CAMNT_0000460253 /DNA_START=62 /DNA_END=1033 /DNA_ORIENTATION=+ /assembly_acc=CAM_ASM_000160